jgi:hypothetical protein
VPDLFVLQLSYLSRDKAQVTVTDSPAGDWQYTMAHPFDPVTLDGLLQVLEKGDLSRCELKVGEEQSLCRLGVMENNRLVGPEERAKRIGQCLYDGLFPPAEGADRDLRAMVETALEQAVQSRRPVPIQLCFDLNAVDLARIPWELLCRGDDPLVLRERLCLTRYITFNRPTVPFPVTDRLEVLVVTARPENIPPLDPTAECLAIEAAFECSEAKDRIHVDHLEPPTLGAFVDRISSHVYHIVHFDGHGTFGRRCRFCERFTTIELPICTNPDCTARLCGVEPEGCLAFEDSAGQAHLVAASELITALSMSHVRLFVASACQSATVGGTSALNSVAPRLIQEVPAVVGMQFSVPDTSARDFAGPFYRALARGDSIAAAVADGRRALCESHTWYIPALYLRSQDGEGKLFRFQDTPGVRQEIIGGDAHGTRIYLWPAGKLPPDWAALRPQEAAPYKYLSPFETTDTAVFYGRETDSQGLVAELLHRRLEVLYGPPGVGKTSLINAGLVPALLRHGYLVLTLREYDRPVEMLCEALARSPALDVDLTGVDSLQGLVDALLRDAGRPLVIVFDEFQEYPRASDADLAERRSTFIQDLAACVKRSYPLPFCLLLVVEEASLGHLSAFEPHLPSILEHRFLLRPLRSEQARRAIEQPLIHYEPPIRYDPAFLEKDLLPALGAEGEEPRINPTHLQIVCQWLYQAALDDKATEIGASQYPEGGAEAILKDYLQQRLRERFPERSRRDQVRMFLKRMVSVSGERVFVPVEDAARDVGLNLDEAQKALRLLQQDALVEGRQSLDGVAVYSLSHPMLADEVHDWFDPEEAKDRGAREVLRRAWDDWYEKGYLAQQQEGKGSRGGGELLVGPVRLRDIRERRQGVPIQAEQLCLLLRSAVFHRCDMAYWAKELAEDDGARRLLHEIHHGPGGSAAQEWKGRVATGAAALGLGPGYVGERALARAAVGHSLGSVRHTAALALGAAWQTTMAPSGSDGAPMGEAGLEETVAALADDASAGPRWRRVQALAQMKASSLRLPHVPGALRVQVDVWRTAIRLAEARWRLAAQAVGAGLGGGFGLLTAMAIAIMLVGYYSLPEIAAYLLVGWVMGVAFAAGCWVFDTLLGGRAWRVLGGSIGFCLGLVSLAPFTPHLAGWQLAGGLLCGGAMVLGSELLADPRKTHPEETSTIWRAGLGGGIGGALAFGVIALTAMRLPFVLSPEFVRNAVNPAPVSTAVVDPSWVTTLVVVFAALAGSLAGLGLTGGSTAGEALWRRLSVGSIGADQDPGSGRR